MTSRKLQTTQITSFFQRKECVGGTTPTTNKNAAVETAAVVTTPRQDVSTAASSSSSLVATQTSTGPSARLVTTSKKRKYTSLSSTDSTPSLSSFFLPRGRTTDKKSNITNSCIVVGNTPSQSPTCNTRKKNASSSQYGSTPNRFAQYVSFQEDLSITSSSSENISQDNDGLHEEDQEEEDQEETYDCKPRSKPSFPQDQSKETLSEQDRSIVNDIIPQEIIDLENQEEDDDDDEEENVSDEHTETTVGSDFCPIEIVGESTARKIIKPYCEESATIIKEENFFESTFGKFAEHIKRRTMTRNSGVYCILSTSGKSILKIGSTKSFRQRYQYYHERYDIEDWRFFIMVDFSNTNETVDRRMNQVYVKMMEKLNQSNKLHPFQRFLVNTLMERGGDRLGAKETIWIQMIEIGLQYELGLAVFSEFAMFSRRVAQELYLTTSKQAQHVMRYLSVLHTKARNGETIPLQALCSWMSGVAYLSSKIETTQCILGEHFRDQFKDTLPFPPVANPRTTHDCFDTSKYTDSQKENGRLVFFQTVTDFLDMDCGIMFMDSNKLILDNDPNCRRSAHDFLTERFKFNHIETILDGEIALYLDASQLHAVVLHKPVCVASDSRKIISHKLRWKRAISVATMCNIGRLVRGEHVLSPEDRFSNPIHAMLAFHVIIRGYHSGHRQAAAFFRDFVTPESINAVLYNGLSKTAEHDPVAGRLRLKYTIARGRAIVDKLDNGEKVRRQDFSIMEQGRSIVNQASPVESTPPLREVVEKLKSLFHSYASLQSGNFRNFVENHLSPELKDQLLQVYDVSTANAGNRTTGPSKAATKVQIASNDGSVAELLKTHAPQDGKLDGERFWIRDKQDLVAHPANGTPSTDPSILFPDGKIVYDDLCLEGLRERFKKRIRQGTCRNTAKAIRYPQFELKTCMVKKQIGRNRCAVSSGGYILVYIVKKETKPDIKKSGDAAIVVPLELHSTQRVKITNWTQQYRECVVCVAKARQQHPDWNRNKLRKQKIVRYSCSGCPQCRKGNGVAVCETCWDEFDHAKFMM
ncbi:hypothetical protein IV203_037142 [Nitzschia inconspicua]|uniref:Uncharacterized protein n=1 Tax=Nitzschia inconspicua TaxID=303405 RepID=A0A9K3PYH1_9STRA|nr:hypothetical protein IV203_037142 [Nitzschia inconspicua]